MFPLRDENPSTLFPGVTIAIIVTCALCWIFLQGMGETRSLAGSLCYFALIPGKVLGLLPSGVEIPMSQTLTCVVHDQGGYYTIITHMFLHGGWFHLIGNLWFLWVFGDNVEDAMGHIPFLIFYLLCGIAAAAAQMVTNPASAIPMVGASGAIGGVMGAYARLYPKAKVYTLIFLGFFITTASIPAIFMLGYWFVIQLLGALPALQSSGGGGGVAFWAHIGGFLAGLLLSGFFSRR